ncbi:MAG: DUF2177 family protein [Sediminimonas qiaohouensis]|uniref:DUF2177 family protein n=1 Tax=Sediminimonas qiaohouensis TaxID=552061 RepID=A0A7C9HLX0_9RHOB|nr:DUF2177 family protein [Sediminimonas qiaohouensis]MTJ04123.1 DUF2177 family protein [Sediminimonas qiaohouensis]
MQIFVAYFATAVVFLALDAVMLKLVLRPLFERSLSGQLLNELRIVPAAMFYLFYIAGLVHFVSMPALAQGAPLKALIGGAILGAMAYGTYEFTNYATLRNWHWHMVAVDLAWGAALTAVSAWAGVMVARLVG